ncbi:MAG TPA: response regulator [Gemmataceae bacterium]|jgi:response regulator NasT|nr:response regulator [Gemmataceae bacterium]
MNRALRIAVAEDEPVMQRYLQETLTVLGHQVNVAGNGKDLIDRCKAEKPELVITDIRLPDMNGLDAASSVYQESPVPIIVISAFHDADLVERAERDHVLAYLVKPIKQQDLEPAISIAMSRFKEFSSMREEADTLRQALEDRKIIERAKGLLMKRANLDEPEAFRRLQKLARDKNQKLVEIAHMIVTAEEAYQATK